MSIWLGETWTCARCRFVNAVLRIRCRNCGLPRPEPEAKPEAKPE